MAKIALFLISMVYCCGIAKALWCWKCTNANSNEDCQRNGRLEHCMFNKNTCYNEVRRGPNGLLFSKSCKQDMACANNKYQNDKHAWWPSQCNPKSPSSACRCCCNFNGCNVEEFCKQNFDCPPVPPPQFGMKRCRVVKSENDIGTVCHFQCEKNHNMFGPSHSTCMRTPGNSPSFNNQPPRCVPIPCTDIHPPHHGFMTCTNGTKVGSVCSFECEHELEIESEIPGNPPRVVPSVHNLVGDQSVVCQRNSQWSGVPPACVAVDCLPLDPPEDVSMSCTYGFVEGSTCSFSCEEGYRVLGASSSVCRHTGIEMGVWTEPIPICIRKRCSNYPEQLRNGSFTCSDETFLHSECEFACNPNYKISGSRFTRCIEEEGNSPSWNFKTPTCERVTCEEQTFLRNGRITCTDSNYATSECSYECVTEDFELNPPTVTTATCLGNSSWNVTKPCCARLCPPYSVVDVVIMIDSSSSIGSGNWGKIKEFVRNLINTFTVGPDAARLGVFRYNRFVDSRSQILLSDFPNDKEGLLNAFDQIPYNGQGTFTGQALRHARNVLLSRDNGNRPDVPDYIIVITDGKSFDPISEVALQLHADGVHVFVIGVVPLSGKLDFNQLNQLVTHPNDLVIAETGFQDLNTNLFDELVEIVCSPGCL